MKRLDVQLSDREAAALVRELTSTSRWGMRVPQALTTAEAKVLAALDPKETR